MRYWFALMIAFGFAFAAEQIAGRFEGEWSSSASGVSGKFHLVVNMKDDKPQAEVTFTLGDQEVKTKIREIKLGPSEIQAAYDFDLQGNLLRSTITGKLSDKILEGSYSTKTVADDTPVDQGTWKATLVK